MVPSQILKRDVHSWWPAMVPLRWHSPNAYPGQQYRLCDIDKTPDTSSPHTGSWGMRQRPRHEQLPRNILMKTIPEWSLPNQAQVRVLGSLPTILLGSKCNRRPSICISCQYESHGLDLKCLILLAYIKHTWRDSVDIIVHCILRSSPPSSPISLPLPVFHPFSFYLVLLLPPYKLSSLSPARYIFILVDQQVSLGLLTGSWALTNDCTIEENVSLSGTISHLWILVTFSP